MRCFTEMAGSYSGGETGSGPGLALLCSLISRSRPLRTKSICQDTCSCATGRRRTGPNNPDGCNRSSFFHRHQLVHCFRFAAGALQFVATAPRCGKHRAARLAPDGHSGLKRCIFPYFTGLPAVF